MNVAVVEGIASAVLCPFLFAISIASFMGAWLVFTDTDAPRMLPKMTLTLILIFVCIGSSCMLFSLIEKLVSLKGGG